MEIISFALSLTTLILVVLVIYLTFKKGKNSDLDGVKTEFTEKFSTSLERLAGISKDIDSLKETTSSMSLPITNLNKY
jgi:hypothetical protein